MYAIRILASIALFQLSVMSARAAWPTGTLGDLMEKCHAFEELELRKGNPKDETQLYDALYCRAFIEGHITGIQLERTRPGNKEIGASMCMPGTRIEVLPMNEVIKLITSEIEKIQSHWGESVGAYPWAIITLNFVCK